MKGLFHMVGYLKRRFYAVACASISEAPEPIKPVSTSLAVNQHRLVEELEAVRKILGRVQYQTTLAPDGLPIPPPEYHAEVSGTDGLDAGVFLEVGKMCSDVIRTILQRQHISIENFHAILDFGCGCGRTIRNFRDLKGPRIFGSDYSPKLVNWCRSHLRFAEFELNQLEPPLPFGERMFDFIYAFSVFTHLSAPLQSAWLRRALQGAEARRLSPFHDARRAFRGPLFDRVRKGGFPPRPDGLLGESRTW